MKKNASRWDVGTVEIGTGSLGSNFNNDSVIRWTLASQVLYKQIPFSCFGPSVTLFFAAVL